MSRTSAPRAAPLGMTVMSGLMAYGSGLRTALAKHGHRHVRHLLPAAQERRRTAAQRLIEELANEPARRVRRAHRVQLPERAAIAQRLPERHVGEIEVQSVAHVGAVVLRSSLTIDGI